jgi:hypothetical protein
VRVECKKEAYRRCQHVQSCLRASVKFGMIQRRLAWPLHKDDTHKSRMVPKFFGIFPAKGLKKRDSGLGMQWLPYQISHRPSSTSDSNNCCLARFKCDKCSVVFHTYSDLILSSWWRLKLVCWPQRPQTIVHTSGLKTLACHHTCVKYCSMLLYR